MSYFDLHCHPSVKTMLLGSSENDRPNCWYEFEPKELMGLADHLTGKVFRSQASLSQLYKGNFNLVVASSYAVEKAILQGSLVEEHDRFATLYHVLEAVGYSNEFLKKITESEISYPQMFEDELNHLIASKDFEQGFKIINNSSEIDPDRLNVILAIEGAHVFFKNLINYDQKEVIEAVKNRKHSPNRFFYVTMTHVTQNPICNHAYGIKFIKSDDFIPKGNGITDIGKKVIGELLHESPEEKRILIDIKHMSLKSRLQFYQMMQSDFKNVPIIASHMGLTGCSYSQMPVFEYTINEDEQHAEVKYVLPKGINDTEFNPWSINLYDEEIPIIIKSGGIIGLNTDRRVLGQKDKIGGEYFSLAEFSNYIGDINKNIEKHRDIHEKMPPLIFEEIRDMFTPEEGIKTVCDSILHIVKMGGDEAWNHISLGTDFDGLVDTVNCFDSADHASGFEESLIEMLPEMAKDSGIEVGDVREKVRKIMSENGQNFVLKHFN